MVWVHQLGSAHWVRNWSTMLVVEGAGLDQSTAELGHRVDPVGRPWRTALVDSGFRRTVDLADAESGQPSRERAAEEVVDALLPGPLQPAIPEPVDLRRLGDADREEVRFDEQDGATRSQARDEVRHRRVDVGDVVENGPRGHQVEGAGVDRAGHDVGLEVVEVGRRGVLVHEGQVDVDGDGLPGRDRPARPARRRPSRFRSRPRGCAHRVRCRAPRCSGGAWGRGGATSARDVRPRRGGGGPARNPAWCRSYEPGSWGLEGGVGRASH